MTNLENIVKNFKQKYPDKIPIIITPINDKQPVIDKNKYLVNKDMLIGEFMYQIKKRIQMDKTEALFIFIKEKNIIPCMTQNIGELFLKYGQEILYLEYSLENTFGSF